MTEKSKDSIMDEKINYDIAGNHNDFITDEQESCPRGWRPMINEACQQRRECVRAQYHTMANEQHNRKRQKRRANKRVTCEEPQTTDNGVTGDIAADLPVGFVNWQPADNITAMKAKTNEK